MKAKVETFPRVDGISPVKELQKLLCRIATAHEVLI